MSCAKNRQSWMESLPFSIRVKENPLQSSDKHFLLTSIKSSYSANQDLIRIQDANTNQQFPPLLPRHHHYRSFFSVRQILVQNFSRSRCDPDDGCL